MVHIPPSHVIGSVIDNFRVQVSSCSILMLILSFGDSTVQKSCVLMTFRDATCLFFRWNYYPCSPLNTYNTLPLYGHQVMAKRTGNLKFLQPTGWASVLETFESWHQIWYGSLIFLMHSPLAHTFHTHFIKIPLIYSLQMRLALLRFIFLFHFPHATTQCSKGGHVLLSTGKANVIGALASHVYSKYLRHTANAARFYMVPLSKHRVNIRLCYDFRIIYINEYNLANYAICTVMDSILRFKHLES
jgi:hypothetical protein